MEKDEIGIKNTIHFNQRGVVPKESELCDTTDQVAHYENSGTPVLLIITKHCKMDIPPDSHDFLTKTIISTVTKSRQ